MTSVGSSDDGNSMATVWLRMAAEWLVSMATVQACMAVQSSMDDVLHLVDEEQNYLF